MRTLALLVALAAATTLHASNPDLTLSLEPVPNSVEMAQDGTRFWCVLQPHAYGLPMDCWPVPPVEQRLHCRRFPEKRTVVCMDQAGNVTTRRHGEPVASGVVGVKL